jgi:tRNA threonylcarbamoyladenosine biosynthesis protein TsaE
MSNAPLRGVWSLTDVQATRRLGASLGRHCPWSAAGALCLFLSGELGTGKTTLAAALLGAMGVSEAVRSPSYALIEIYGLDARLAVHVDLYRLNNVAELEQLGLRDYLQSDTLLLIEWPEHGEGALPNADLWLHLELPGPGAPACGSDGRLCRVQARSSAGEAWLGAVRADLPLSDTV